MTYPYGTKGAPAVGNGLGGLPRRAVAAAAAAAGVERTYTFAQVFNTSFTPGDQSSPGAIMYFSDTNIYYVPTNSTSPWKSSLNRGARTLASFTNTGSISSGAEHADSHFDIRISDTVIASSVNGRRITRSGDTLTAGTVVPTSGTTTIGGVSYSTSIAIQVRAIPGSSGYVAVIPANSTSTGFSIVFRLDENLNILASASIRTHPSAPGQIGDALVTNDGVLIVVRLNTDTSPTVSYTAINVDTLASIQRVDINFNPQGDTYASYEWHGATIDLQTNRVYQILSAVVSGSSRNFLPFFTQFNKTTGLFTHFNGTQGNQSITVLGGQANALKLTSTESVMALISTNIKSFGFTPSRVFHNQYSRMIQIPATTSSSGWSLKVPYAPQNFSDPSNLNFLDVVQERSSGTNSIAALPPLASRNRYQLFWTADPTNGFSNRVSSTAISIGDNLFLSAQLVGDSSAFTCHAKLFLRTEA